MSIWPFADSADMLVKVSINLILCAAACGCTLAADGGDLNGLPAAVTKELRNPDALPQGKYSRILQLEAEDGVYGHETGRQISDKDAEQGKAWAADIDTDRPGHILYGPYIDVKAGDYVAFFRLRATDDPSDYTAARLDACTSEGKNTLAARDVICTDVSQDRYTQIPLGFRHPGGKLECRVWWNQGASVAVDRVEIYALEGGKLEPYRAVNRVPAPTPSGSPNDLACRTERKTFSDLFPRSAAPEPRLTVVDLTGQPPDRQLLIRSIQGIVNREKPQIYCIGGEQDRKWLDWMLKRGWVRSVETAAGAEDLLARFGSCVKGSVVFDPALPHSRNAATMLAGLENAAVVSPRLAKSLSLPVIADLRGKWKTSAEVYRWALDNLWPRMNHNVIACLWPDSHELRDYLAANNIFICWIPGPIDGAMPYSKPDEEMRIVEELLSLAPPNIPIMGYSYAGPDVGIGEFGGVDLFSRFGKFLVGSVQAANLTVHSGIRVEQFRQPARPAPPLARDKVYVCFTMSDGDNIPVMTTFNWPQLWADKARGDIPVGWTISPAAWMLIPAIMDYYYSTATPNDTFMAAVSGVGYCYPQSYGQRYAAQDRERVFNEFLSLTDQHMRKMDLRAVCPSLAGSEGIERFAARVNAARAVFADYGKTVTQYRDATYISERGIPVFRAATSWNPNADRKQKIREMAQQIRAMAGGVRPAFLHVFICNWFWDIPAMKDVMEELGDGFLAVGPDQLAQLYTRYAAQERIQTSGLAGVAYFDGQRIELSASVRNTSGRSLHIESITAEGLSRAAVKPAALCLQPWKAADIKIAGRPASSEVRVRFAGDFDTRTESAPLWRVQEDELIGPLPDPGNLKSLNLFEAESLNHQSGVMLRDPGASGKAAWASPQPGSAANHLVFGPYASLAAGRYLAVFRIKRTGEGSGVAVRLDVSTDSGNRILCYRDVDCAELASDEYRSIALEFDHPGGAIETRVYWTGRAAVAADFAAVWRLGQ